MRLAILAAAMLIAVPAYAQDSTSSLNSPVTAVNGTPPDGAGNVTVAVPVAASALPPSETVNPTIGTAGTYRPADSIPVRITRAGTCTISAGVCSVTWATALPSVPTVILEPVNSTAAQPIMCNPTAVPTTTGVAVKCWIVQTTSLSLAIVTSGLTLSPAAVAPNGTVVMVTAIPPTQ